LIPTARRQRIARPLLNGEPAPVEPVRLVVADPAAVRALVVAVPGDGFQVRPASNCPRMRNQFAVHAVGAAEFHFLVPGRQPEDHAPPASPQVKQVRIAEWRIQVESESPALRGARFVPLTVRLTVRLTWRTGGLSADVEAHADTKGEPRVPVSVEPMPAAERVHTRRAVKPASFIHSCVGQRAAARSGSRTRSTDEVARRRQPARAALALE